jgi:uncharacterized protein YPO0396
MQAMPMAGQLLRPEDATNWDDFLDRIAGEVGAKRSAAVIPHQVLDALRDRHDAIGYAAVWEDPWWLRPLAIVPQHNRI